MEHREVSQVSQELMNLLPEFYRIINPLVNSNKIAGYDLSENHIKILGSLYHNNKVLSPSKMSKFLNIQKGSLSHMLKALVDLKLITTKKDDNDNRKYYVLLTKKGDELFKQQILESTRVLEQLFLNMENDSKLKVVNGLQELINYLTTKGDVL